MRLKPASPFDTGPQPAARPGPGPGADVPGRSGRQQPAPAFGGPLQRVPGHVGGQPLPRLAQQPAAMAPRRAAPPPIAAHAPPRPIAAYAPPRPAGAYAPPQPVAPYAPAPRQPAFRIKVDPQAQRPAAPPQRQPAFRIKVDPQPQGPSTGRPDPAPRRPAFMLDLGPRTPVQAGPPDAYPIQVRQPGNGPALFHPRQARATSVPVAQVPRNLQHLYRDLNLKVTSDTRPAYTNHDLLARPRPLGQGAFNTVYEVKLRQPDGGTLDGVFKPLSGTERGWVASATGIPRDDPQIAMRNIATQAYGRKLLGIDVVADTRVAAIEAGPHAQVEGPKLGLVMERAQGQEAARMSLADLQRPDVRAEVTKLQLLDHLTGQGDRHGKNFFVDLGSGRAKVTGIDNDQCFGARLTDPNGIHYARDRTQYGFRGTRLPPVVDTEMATRIKSLTPDRIRAELGDKLSPAEVDAAVERHAAVKRHIDGLARQGRVIAPADWGQPWVAGLMRFGNSYIGREVALAADRQRGW